MRLVVPPVVLFLWLSWKETSRERPWLPSGEWSSFPWKQEHKGCSVSKSPFNRNFEHTQDVPWTGVRPGNAPQPFTTKTSEQNLRSQQKTDGQGAEVELMPKWLTRSVDVWIQVEAGKSHCSCNWYLCNFLLEYGVWFLWKCSKKDVD